VTSGPGGGKTCVLLDLVERLEADDAWVVLFVKGDQYEGARTRVELADRGLPDDIVGEASRLSLSHRVVIVVDALDVLSLQRTSGTLALFLGLLDELVTLDAVSVVAACRDFDLQYAPELRDREWNCRVRVGPLSHELVDEVLRGWALDPDTVDDKLREHLRVPQHLRLFGQLVRSGVTHVAAGPYALHDRFLDVVVEQAQGLGAPGMSSLYEFADRLQRERRLTLPRSAFPGDPALVRRLLSTEVLIEPQSGMLSFSHQELLDCVAVRGAVRRGETLLDFLLSRPALPFVRPTARTFLFMLRAQDADDFRRQARRALDATELAYHLRRLIAESLAEIVPEVEDRRLLLFLMRRHPDLFERLAGRLQNRAWLDHVRALLDEVRVSADGPRWTVRLLRLMNTWTASEPAVVVGAWWEALHNEWPGIEEARWEASRAVTAALKGLPDGARPPAAVGDVIRQLLDLPDPQRHLQYDLSPMVQRWVEAMDTDDDFIRRVLERGAAAHQDGDASPEFRESFLEHRLAVSDDLMEWAYGVLQREVKANEVTGWRGLLHSTSYEGRHARGMLGPVDAWNGLARAFERAIVRRAHRGDTWWQEHETQLRRHDDSGFRYLVMRGYEAAPERHARAIASFVADCDVLDAVLLSSEVRELAHRAYPFFDDDEREAHQRAVLAQYETDEEGQRRAWYTYGHLVWVPRPWRTPETETFVEAWEPTFGPWRPLPEITNSGGAIPAPFDSDQLLALSDEDAVRLALFFGTEGHWQTDGWGKPIGGWDQAVGVYRDGASRAPSRMIRLLPQLIEHVVAPPYLDAIVDGLGMFIRLRFGNLKSSDGWSPAEDHEEGEAIGQKVLRLLEQFEGGFRDGYSQAPTWKEDGAPWLSEHTAAGAIRACAAVLTHADDLRRLAIVLERLSTSGDPEPDTQSDASHVALNSVRGQVGDAAVLVAGSLLADSAPLPALLEALLSRLANDPVPGVRASIVEGLPYVTQFDQDQGWALAEQALSTPDTEVWQRGERLLYHNYFSHYSRVAPYLDVLRESDLAPETYGRISMLSALAGHLDAETFIRDLGQREGVWKGVVQVLVANLASAASREACVALLDRLFLEADPPDIAVDTVVYEMSDDVLPHVPRRLIDRLIMLRDDAQGFRITRVAEWIELEAVRDPASAAEALGELAAASERSSSRGFYGAKEALGRALNAVLRDADESDEPDFIRRAVELQDRLTRLGLIDADALFEASVRR